jgi:hypothetical protein
VLGRNRPARDIEPAEITDLIRPIYDRGKRSMADHVWSSIRSAYSWGMKSEHDYRNPSVRRSRLVYNPAAGIPTEGWLVFGCREMPVLARQALIAFAEDNDSAVAITEAALRSSSARSRASTNSICRQRSTATAATPGRVSNPNKLPAPACTS